MFNLLSKSLSKVANSLYSRPYYMISAKKKSFPLPSEKEDDDVSLQFLTRKRLFNEVSNKLGVKYLSPLSAEFKTFDEAPIKGVLWGPTPRVVIPTSCCYNAQNVAVFFIMNFPSKKNFLSEDACKALGVKLDANSSVFIEVHGVPLQFFLSKHYFKNFCLLGTNFLKDEDLSLQYNFKARTAILERDESARRITF